MIYDGADNAIKYMNRANLKAFGRLKMAKWDEVNLIKEVGKVYDDSVKLAKTKYYEVAIEAYTVALYMAKIDHKKATRMAEDAITMDWIMLLLEEADPVLLYEFMSEAERKKYRLIEALSVAQDKSREIDRALRYWTVQVSQMTDNMVYAARMQAFENAGIERVRWVTQKDNRVCHECDELDEMVFPINEVPPPQHYGCRCYIVPAS